MRNYKIDIPLVQYLIGATCNLVLLLVLMFSSTESFRNIQLPQGEYSDNIQVCSDVMSYVGPAENFLKYGTFGSLNKPDHFRTIGYPSYLAVNMKIFGSKWLYATYVINCLLFALIYPILSFLSNTLTNNVRVARGVFLFSLFSGTYMVKAIYIGTDVFFFFLFIGAIFFLVKFIKTHAKYLLIFYLLIISAAAQVRPTLSLFFIANIFLFYFFEKVIHNRKPLVKHVFITSTILIVTCNIPSIRNYVNYGFFKQSSILDEILFEYTGKKVLAEKNKEGRYDSLDARLQRIDDIKVKMKGEDSIAISIMKQYPLTALKVVFIENAQNVLLDNHLTNSIANYYGYSWKEVKPFKARELDCHGYKRLTMLTIAYYVMAAIYLILYGFFIRYLWRLFRKRNWLQLVTIIVFLGMFLLPTIVGGSGGARFRIDVEWIIAIFSMNEIFRFFGRKSDKNRVAVT